MELQNDFKHHLQKLIQQAQTSFSDTKLLLIVPTPIAEENPEKQYYIRSDMMFVAQQLNIPVLDTWETFLSETVNLENYNASAMRPFVDANQKLNSDGNELFYSALLEKIKSF